MNFLDLYKRIHTLDEGLSQGDMSVQAIGAAPSNPELTSEEMCTECGGDMPPHPAHAAGQSDSVTMNVSMSGSGKGGIRDLINVLQNIEHGVENKDVAVISNPSSGIELPMMGDDYANEPAPETSEIDAVMSTGDDLHSKGLEAEKQAGGGNPWNQMDISESLVKKLSDHYDEVKEGYGYRGYGRPKGRDSFGNPLGGGHDEYRDDPYGHKEAAKLREKDRGPWYLIINNKVYTQQGEPKAFDWKNGANNYAMAIIKKRPELDGKILLTKNKNWMPKNDVGEGYGSRGHYRSPGSGMGWSQEAEKRDFKRREMEHELGHEDRWAAQEASKPVLKGYYFYNIPSYIKPSDVSYWGLKQTKSGKWALPIYDKSGSSTMWRKSELDKEYGEGKWWAPKK